MNKRKRCMRYRITVALVFIMILPILAYIGASAEPHESSERAVDVELGEMVCRIRNISSGLYLDTYKYTAKTKGKAYLQEYSESSLGQVFHISPCDDGTYRIIPQSESGEYVYSYSAASADDVLIKKVKAASADKGTQFDIVEYSDNEFIIAPSNAKNSRGVLTKSETKTEHKDYYTEISTLNENAENQLWAIEPIKTEKLTVIYSSTKVRLYSTGTFFARKHPYNAYTHDIKWSSSNEDAIMVGNDGTWCALGVGTAVITASVGDISKSFEVKVSDKDAFTWYSQNNIFTSDWDATSLLSLSFYADGVRKKFAVDSKAPGGDNCWMDEGCGNCAVAMVLNNMGAKKTTGYDFRSGQIGDLVADPYTVALANSGNYGKDITSPKLSGNPIYMRWAYVAEQFNVDGKTVKMNKIYSPSRTKIKNLLKEHPEGVVVQLSRGTTMNHYIVFTECINPDEKNSKLEFMVCDSAAYTPEYGDYVPFKNSTSYVYEKYTYSNIISVMYYTLED